MLLVLHKEATTARHARHARDLAFNSNSSSKSEALPEAGRAPNASAPRNASRSGTQAMNAVICFGA